MAPEGASELRRRPVRLSDGTELEKGEQADVDRFDPSELLTYRALVLRRSPAGSRPPAVYRLAWRGRFYDVWVRPASPAPAGERLTLGTEVDPAGVPRCADVLRLARGVGPGGRLVAAGIREEPVALPLGETGSGGLVPSAAGSTYLEPDGPGVFTVRASVSHRGAYRVWLGGSLRPAATLYVDGERISGVRQQLNTPGNYLDFGPVELSAGPHAFSVRVGGPDLHPGSAGSDGPLGPLVIDAEGSEPQLTYVRPRQARQLCGKAWDWIEVAPAPMR